VQILDEICCGCISESTTQCLNNRVIEGKIVDNLDLCEKGQSPVCLFLPRKACSDFNTEMLSTLDSKMCKLNVWMKLMRLLAHINEIK